MEKTGGAEVIGHYEYLHYDDASEVFRPYDPRFPEVAERLATLIQAKMPDARVEHVGSTAIPGCAGKGIIDLLVTYPLGRLAAARDALDELGFQRQQGRDPFPEERPLRLGTIEHDGETFRIHAHVIAAGDSETLEQLHFRDTLRADPALVEEYVVNKRAALTRDGLDNIVYNEVKAPFIRKVIGR